MACGLEALGGTAGWIKRHHNTSEVPRKSQVLPHIAHTNSTKREALEANKEGVLPRFERGASRNHPRGVP